VFKTRRYCSVCDPGSIIRGPICSFTRALRFIWKVMILCLQNFLFSVGTGYRVTGCKSQSKRPPTTVKLIMGTYNFVIKQLIKTELNKIRESEVQVSRYAASTLPVS
jgi:hypothetical protein